MVVALDAVEVRVLLNDRDGMSPGVSFRDAELIGVPLIVTLGRGLATGEIELRDRWSDERRHIPLDGAVEQLTRLVAETRQAAGRIPTGRHFEERGLEGLTILRSGSSLFC